MQTDDQTIECGIQEAIPWEPTTYDELLRHPSINFSYLRSHVLWEAAAFIRVNPGCRLREINEHLLSVYPHGRPARYKVGRGILERAEIAKHQARDRSQDIHKSGYYITDRGLLLLSGPKPKYTREKPKVHSAMWALVPEVGGMYAPRGRNTCFYVERQSETGPVLTYGGSVPKDSVMILLDVQNVSVMDSAEHFRLFGGPIAYGYAEFMVDGKKVHIDVSQVKLLGRRLKRKS